MWWPARYPFKGNGSQEIVFPVVCSVLAIVNDGPGTLTFTIGTKFVDQFTLSLYPGETFHDTVRWFDRVSISANGEYRGWIRQDPNCPYSAARHLYE